MYVIVLLQNLLLYKIERIVIGIFICIARLELKTNIYWLNKNVILGKLLL